MADWPVTAYDSGNKRLLIPVTGDRYDFTSNDAVFKKIVFSDGTFATTAASGTGASGALLAANNLSEVVDPAAALANLGGLAKALNLSDVSDAATALANLGGLAKAITLSDVADAATALGNLGGVASSLLGVANGVATLDSSGNVAPSQLIGQVTAQCYASLSAGTVVLNRENGKYLMIDGVLQEIPSGGVTLDPTGAPTGTKLLVYAYMNAGAMTLEYSTTAWTVDSTTGMPIKTGDSTRTLVAMAYCQTTAATVSHALSYFNRRNVALNTDPGSSPTVTATSWTEFSGNATRIYFLSWGDEACQPAYNLSVWVNNAARPGDMKLMLDGTTQVGRPSRTYVFSNTYAYFGVSFTAGFTASEGFHYLAVFGKVPSNTMTLYGTYNNLGVIVRG